MDVTEDSSQNLLDMYAWALIRGFSAYDSKPDDNGWTSDPETNMQTKLHYIPFAPNFSDWELCLHYGPYLCTLSWK